MSMDPGAGILHSDEEGGLARSEVQSEGVRV